MSDGKIGLILRSLQGCFTVFLTALFLLGLSSKTVEAQFDDCPQLHVCLVSCTNDVLVGGSQQQFNNCTDGCLNKAKQCPENQNSNDGFMKQARSCSQLHSCLVSCQDPVLSGGTNDELFSCDDRCFANNGQCKSGNNNNSNNNNYNSNNNNSNNNNYNSNNNNSNNNAAKRRKLARAIQQELKDAKCNPGAVDGVWGNRSNNALKRFGRENGLSIPNQGLSQRSLDIMLNNRDKWCKVVKKKKKKKKTNNNNSNNNSNSSSGGSTTLNNPVVHWSGSGAEPSIAGFARGACKQQGFDRATDWSANPASGISSAGSSMMFEWVDCE